MGVIVFALHFVLCLANINADWIGLEVPYTEEMDVNKTFEIENYNHPQFAVVYNLSIAPYTYVAAYWNINDTRDRVERILNNLGGTFYGKTQFVMSPCELWSPVTLTAAIWEFSSSSNETGVISTLIQPASTQLFEPDGGLSGVNTAFCCTTYFYFNISDDGHEYNIIIHLSAVNGDNSLPFSEICIKLNDCPRNIHDSCIYSENVNGSAEFKIEAWRLKAGDYYVRLETDITPLYTQDYNITATKFIHREPRSFLVYVIVFSVAGGLLLILIAVLVVYMFRRRQSKYIELH